jgi:hypothetical protein
MKTIAPTLRHYAAQCASPSPKPDADASTAKPDRLDPLIRRVAHGDRRAAAHLSYVLRPELVDEARRLVADSLAEDAVQELFARLIDGSLRPPRPRESAIAWLLRMLGTVARELAWDPRENRRPGEKIGNRPPTFRKTPNRYLYRARGTGKGAAGKPRMKRPPT